MPEVAARRLWPRVLAAALGTVIFLLAGGQAWAQPPSPTAPPCSPAQATGCVMPSAPAVPASPEGGCGFIDVGCKAREAIDGWFAHLVRSAAEPVLAMLGSTILATPELDAPSMARSVELWELSRTIANTCFVLLVTVAGVLLIAGQSMPGQVSPRELVPRLIWAFLAANLSLIAIGYAITLANGLSQAFLADAGSRIDPETVAKAIGKMLLAGVASQGVFIAIVALVVVVLAVAVVFTYVVRLALTMVVIAAAPLGLILHALPMTEGIARLWWRSLAGLLAIQVAQSLVLVTAVQLLFAKNPAGTEGLVGQTDLSDLLMAICLLFILVKIPGWVARTIWQANKPQMLSRVVKSLVLYRGLRMVTKGGGAASGGRPPRPPGTPGAGPGGPSGGPGGRRRGPHGPPGG
ncbi:hypothetical protein, partial [Actinocorallia lasiicapitis]